ncbi:unnamed protein product [Brassica rapa subsp. trilocularis]
MERGGTKESYKTTTSPRLPSAGSTSDVNHSRFMQQSGKESGAEEEEEKDLENGANKVNKKVREKSKNIKKSYQIWSCIVYNLGEANFPAPKEIGPPGTKSVFLFVSNLSHYEIPFMDTR